MTYRRLRGRRGRRRATQAAVWIPNGTFCRSTGLKFVTHQRSGGEENDARRGGVVSDYLVPPLGGGVRSTPVVQLQIKKKNERVLYKMLSHFPNISLSFGVIIIKYGFNDYEKQSANFKKLSLKA